MPAFETRCRQSQFGVQGYRSSSCKMKLALRTVSKYITPKPCKQVYEALRKEGSGKAQFQSMRNFLVRLKVRLNNWESSFCEKCRPIFHRMHEDWIKICIQYMDRLIEDKVEPGQRASYFDITISNLKFEIKILQSQNQCITIKKKKKTQQQAQHREELFNEEKSEKPRPHTNEQQFKKEE